MQYHYVVGYDDKTRKWFLELDTSAYFPDGNVYNPDATDYGWCVSDPWDGGGDPSVTCLDNTLLNILFEVTNTLPIPEENNVV